MSVLIIGSGFAGLCMAIRLKQAGIEDFVVLEKAGELGGTWRDNSYPGCACDVQSHLYSFSFEPNPNWSRMFAPYWEIQAYLKHCAEKYDVLRHIRFNEGVERAEYDEARAEWVVRTSRGTEHRARVLVSGMGFLSIPAVPDIPGRERFAGEQFHSAQWNHDYDLAGKRVAVIGTGASAIQFVPAIASRVESIDLYQRTPSWVLPKPDRAITRLEKGLFGKFPLAQWLARLAIYWKLEARVLAMALHPRLLGLVQRQAVRYIESEVSDPELRRKLTPDYTIGCKRILLSNDWYAAVSRRNVNVITERISEITEQGVVTDDGVERPVDAIIYGTGFSVQEPLPRGLFVGRGGQDIWDAWEDGLAAYKGTTVSGFPNLFLLAGPNTGLGHSSMVFMIESQVAYVMDAIQKLERNQWASVDVRQAVQDAYNAELQTKQVDAVWASGCRSWYLDKNGRNTAIWPDFTFRFRKQTAVFDDQAYAVGMLRPNRAPAPQPIPSALTAVQEAS